MLLSLRIRGVVFDLEFPMSHPLAFRLRLLSQIAFAIATYIFYPRSKFLGREYTRRLYVSTLATSNNGESPQRSSLHLCFFLTPQNGMLPSLRRHTKYSYCSTTSLSVLSFRLRAADPAHGCLCRRGHLWKLSACSRESCRLHLNHNERAGNEVARPCDETPPRPFVGSR